MMLQEVSEIYIGRPVCSALKVVWRVLSVCTTQAEACEAVWGVHWKRMEGESTGLPWLWPVYAGLAEDGLHVLEQYHIKQEYILSRRNERSADATDVAVASSKDEWICLKEGIWWKQDLDNPLVWSSIVRLGSGVTTDVSQVTLPHEPSLSALHLIGTHYLYLYLFKSHADPRLCRIDLNLALVL